MTFGDMRRRSLAYDFWAASKFFHRGRDSPRDMTVVVSAAIKVEANSKGLLKQRAANLLAKAKQYVERNTSSGTQA